MPDGLSLGTLWLEIAANVDDALKTLKGFGDDVSKQIDKQKKSWEGLSKVADNFSDVGKNLSLYVTAPLLGISAAALKTSKDFESSFNRVSAMGDIVGDDLKKLQKQALDLGKQTAFSAQQAADGMAVFASAGFNAEKIYATMPGTLNLAAAGQLKVADAAVITKDILGQFRLEAQDSGHVADILAKASADASASLGDMATTLRYVGPTAHDMGLSIEDVTAAIVELDKSGLKGEQAGTGLRGVLASLIPTSKEAREAMEQLGVTIDDGAGKIKPLPQIIEEYRIGLKNLGGDVERQTVMQQIFGREAGVAARILIQEGGPALTDYSQKLKTSAGAADDMAKKLNSGLNYQLDQMSGSVETAGIALGNILIPFANKALKIVTDLVNNAVMPAVEWFGKWPAPAQLVALALGAIGAAAGPALFLVGQMASAFINIATATSGALKILTNMGGAISNVAYAITNNLTGALTGGEAALMAFGVAAAYGLAILAGAALGNWLGEMETARRRSDDMAVGLAKLGDKIKDLDQKLKDGKITLEQYNQAIVNVGHAEKQSLAGSKFEQAARNFRQEVEKTKPSVADLEKELAKYGVGIVQGSRSTETYTKALIDQIAHMKEIGATTNDESKAIAKTTAETNAAATAAEEAAKRQAALAKAAADAAERHDKLTKNLKDAKDELEQLTAMAKQSGVGWDQVSAAAKKVEKQQDALNAEFLATHKTIGPLTGSVDSWVKSLKQAPPGLDAAARATIELNTAAENAAVDIDLTAQSLAGVSTVAKIAGVSLTATKIPVFGLTDAMRQLGITSVEQMTQTAIYAQRAFETIRDSGVATSTELRQAHILALRAIQDAYYQAGQSVPAADQIMLAQLEIQERNYRNNSINGWRQMFESINASFQDVFASLNEALVTGDWAKFKDRAIQDLENIGIAVVDKFLKPLEDGIASLLAGGLAKLLSGAGLGGVSDALAGIGAKMGGVFAKAGTDVAGVAVDAGGAAISSLPLDRVIPGVADTVTKTATSTASSVAGGVMKGVMGVLNPISMVADVVGSVAQVLALFGVGKGGEMDRLNNIANDTRFLAWCYDTGRVYLNIWDIRNALMNSGASIDRIAIAAESIDAKMDALQNAVTRDLTMNLYGTDPQTVAAYIGAQLRRQGGTA